MAGPPFLGADVPRMLAGLRERRVNYDHAEVAEPAWHFDHYRTSLPSEQPGPPEPGGVWETACRLVHDYEFSTPEIVRAVFDPTEPLPGRTMLLECRFSVMRFYLGVRVTAVTDETRPGGQRVWGWAYETLEGHLERGRISYEVVKHEGTGQVEFVIDAFSQRAPTLGPVMRLGWRLFGRWTQRRFYEGCGRRMTMLTALPSVPRRHQLGPGAPCGLTLRPSDARSRRLDRLALRFPQPGWNRRPAH